MFCLSEDAVCLIFLNFSLICHCVYYCWSFIEKTSVKQHLKCKLCSNFQIAFLHLVRWTPLQMTLQVRLTFLSDLLVRLTFHQTSGWVDLWSDVSPSRDILWPCVILLQVRLIFGQMYPPAETFCGQV